MKPGVLFTSYTSPNDAFNTVHELAVVLAFDDSGNTVPLNPKAILAFELDGPGRRRQRTRGTYLELGVRPVVPLSRAREISGDAGDSRQDRVSA